jgi:L-aspartate oxidase
MILITQSVKELKLLMSDYVGIVRNNERLQRAMKRLDLLFTETEELYTKNKCIAAIMRIEKYDHGSIP